MREFAESFYKSKQWQRTRSNYISKCGGLCETCMAKGIYKPGDIVHHIKHITPVNITNPEITLSFDNLIYVCRDCHGKAHAKNKKRFSIDEYGMVFLTEDSPIATS